MSIITFTSDFGLNDHYVASVKGKILCLNPELNIIDISHTISEYDIAHAAFVVRSAFRDFPAGTVHLIAVNTIDRNHEGFVAFELENHFFVGANNGTMALLSNQTPNKIVELLSTNETVFPAKSLLSKAAVYLANGNPLEELGDQIPELRQMVEREVRYRDNEILGHVIHVDHYGNLVTNISLDLFNRAKKDQRFTIKFGREHINILSDTYSRFEEGDCVVLFNSSNLLEIAINKGNASQLLGLRYDSPISITFD